MAGGCGRLCLLWGRYQRGECCAAVRFGPLARICGAETLSLGNDISTYIHQRGAESRRATAWRINVNVHPHLSYGRQGTAMSSLRERQKEERREAILDAAVTLFDQLGYSATTVEQIAARAGVSAPTVFNYFGSKQDILYALAVRADTLA